ncbi:Protein spinster 1, partial [Tyrophagus putrescentiae]
MATINSYVCVAILCFVNLLNYMDRFTIAGVLDEIKKYFEINDATAGLLQTVFICSYMVFAPVFGFLGDRYSRKIIIIFGVLFWSSVTLLSSFVQPHHTGLFFLFRGLVGIGEASYSTVAPTIIADLFVGKKRSTMIALFYFAIPVGSGLGYIVGSQMASIFGSWHWALRFTPTFGLLAVVGFLFITEPERGAMESERYQPPVQDEQEPSSTGFRSTLASLQRDAAYLVSVPTYVLTTLGFTISFIFGAIACVGGILGVLMGSLSSQYFRQKYPTVDSYICAIGVFTSIPCAFLTIFIVKSHPTIAWISIFLAITFLSTNWSVTVDILLYVIVPNRRSSAQALQILTAHILGDASSPFIISSAISKDSKDENVVFSSLSYALYLTPFVLIFGAFFFFFSARFLLKDESRCKHALGGSESALSSNDSSPNLRATTTEVSTLMANSNTNLIQRVVDYSDSQSAATTGYA